MINVTITVRCDIASRHGEHQIGESFNGFTYKEAEDRLKKSGWRTNKSDQDGIYACPGCLKKVSLLQRKRELADYIKAGSPPIENPVTDLGKGDSRGKKALEEKEATKEIDQQRTSQLTFVPADTPGRVNVMRAGKWLGYLKNQGAIGFAYFAAGDVTQTGKSYPTLAGAQDDIIERFRSAES